MDTNKLSNTTDFESVASAVYEAIDSQLEPEEDDDDVNDEEMEHYSKSPQMRLLADQHNEDEENLEESTTHQSKGEEEPSSMSINCQMDDESSPFVLEKRVAPLIVQDDSGLIKKIKISTAKNLVQRFTQNMATAPAVTPPKTEKLTIKGLQQHSPSQQQPRSSTPLSREYLALQKTQNDSKIIKKFVTDARIEKTRKGKAKEQNSGSTPTTPTGSNNNSITTTSTSTVITSSDHSYTSRRRSNNNSLISPDKEYVESGGGGPHTSISQQMSKRHRHGRFAPLKDADFVDATPTTLQSQRSRSKSMHNSSSNHSDDEHSNSSSSHQILKKWPSEERVASTKRTNMRSENSEFVQKQKEFLQHVINSTQDTPQRTLFRARSTGTESDTSNQTKLRRPRERSSKRLAAEFEHSICDNEDVLVKRTRSRTRSRSVGNTSGVESTTAESENQTKRYKSKRLKDDTTADEVDSKLMLSQSIVMECSTTTDDHGDGGESSLNNSHNSTLAANTSTDVTTTTTTTTRSTSTENLDNLQSLKKVWQPPPKPGSDSFCWKCHEANVNVACSKCVRSFHTECAKDKLDSAWFCPECTTVENILNSTKKSRRNELSVDLLSQLLAFALKRMRFAKGSYSFVMPYEDENIYKKIIVNPVHFGTLQEKIDSKEYRCAEEFVNDTKWMLHNAYILSSGNNTKTVLGTKGILKICRQEVNEIETCAECYLNANTRTDWFVDVCSQPHLLLWAKLKGFPYWPAKAMNFGQNSLVNVRFFGQHDRAFVSVKECFLYSERDPNIQTGKRAARELADCMKEVEEHIERIKSKVGGFKYAPFKTPYDPTDEMAQLEAMMPGVQDFIKKQLVLTTKPSLQFKIYKTADNHLSIVQKASSTPDLSTPPQQQQQLQQEITADELPTSAKKKKCFSANEEAKKTEEMSSIVPAAKYEVISKVTSDDSNSSKLSTVILKRKAVHVRGGDDTKKSPQEEETPHSELPLPKMQRIEEGGGVIVEESKRKVEIVGIERAKDKYGKQELRIPAITIKTTCTPKDMLSLGNEIQKSATEESEQQQLEKDKTVLAITPKSQQKEKEFSNSNTPSSTTSTPTATQKVVENLVKNKQGVTIKKIPKEAPVTTTTTVVIATSSDSLTLPTSSPINPNISQTSLRSFEVNKAKETAITSTKQPAEKPADRLAKGKLEEDKNLDDQHVTSILKGLVPFVEIKREILSDNEERQEDEVSPKTATEELGKHQTNVKPNSSSSSVTPNTRSHMKECQSLITSNNSNNNSTQKEVEPPSPPPAALITQVKEEIFSDDDENTGPSKETSKQINSAASSSIVKTSNEVRVVGDTTIQKLSSRNATQLLGNINQPSKRKGVPYGPLPASAFPRVFIETLSSDILGTQPRAKKSFPQCSPSSHDQLRTSPDNANANGSLPSAATSGSQQDANKRTMSKNTMVTIPVDRTNCNSAIITNVPVPPLTAVSKTMPSSNLYNSMARSTATVTVTVSGTSASGLSNPLVMSTKTSTVASYLSSASSCTSPAITRNSPITVATSILPSYTATATATSTSASTSTLSSVSSSATTATTTATSAATAINPTQNSYVNPLVLSTPPPLAGLSGINLNTNSLLNGGSGCVITPTPTTESISTTTTTTSISTTDSQNQPQQQQHPHQPPPPQQQHVPNEALTSAISDSLCRSIPKLLARPKGGLLHSSEERPTFPSQAGPVCNRLFHNSFKVADVLITVIEDTIGELAQGDEASLQAKLTLVTMELERSKLAQEEMRKNMEIEKNRLVKSMENEKNRLVSETRKQCQLEWKQREIELKRAIDETKRKQWCAQCGREANFYCCWNTSYCDYPCQQLHWRWHAANCAQTRTGTQETTLATGGAAVSASNVQTATAMQEQRHHITTKSSNQNNSSSLITPANVNIKSSTALKKEKNFAKNAASSNNMLSSSSSSMTATPSSRSNNSAEVLKLPTNTYIRPVSSSMGQQTLRCNTTYSIPVQRFNAPLPITTPANSTNGPHTYTIVQQGNSSWVMSTGSSANAANNATVAAPIVSVPQIGQHRSGSAMTANKSTKTQIRHH